MNKIKIVDDEIKVLEVDDSLKIETIPKNFFFDVTTLNIDVVSSTDLIVEYSTRKAVKLNIKINILDNVDFNFIEYRYGKNFKIQYCYEVGGNSNCNIYKFYDVKGIKEMSIVNLNKEKASMNYFFKTISTGCEKYNMVINHNDKNTDSNIINDAVNILKGNVSFNVSSFVTQHNINCNVIQDSRIVNLTSNKCQIKPNLFIDEYDVNANHSAHIGALDPDTLFYLNSRGIDNERCEYLLISGLLCKDMPKFLISKIKRNINKYWR